MRCFLLSFAVLYTIHLVVALPSAPSTDSFDDKHPLRNRQNNQINSFPIIKIDEPLPLDVPCTYLDVSFHTSLGALATDNSQDRAATRSTGLIAVGKSSALPGIWKKMGDCPLTHVQIKDNSPEGALIGTYSSPASLGSIWLWAGTFPILRFADAIESSQDRGCCLNDPLICAKRSVGICKSTAIQYNCRGGVWSKREYAHFPLIHS